MAAETTQPTVLRHLSALEMVVQMARISTRLLLLLLLVMVLVMVIMLLLLRVLVMLRLLLALLLICCCRARPTRLRKGGGARSSCRFGFAESLEGIFYPCSARRTLEAGLLMVCCVGLVVSAAISCAAVGTIVEIVGHRSEAADATASLLRVRCLAGCTTATVIA